MPGDDYRVVLVPPNEAVEYSDSEGVHRFGVTLRSGEWTVFLPGTRGDRFEPHELSADEEARILPRISKYLSRIKWFGIFPRSYTVRFAQRKDGSPRTLSQRL